MEKKFAIGDIVTLKSGGPRMTVTKHVGTLSLNSSSQYSGNVECTWFMDGLSKSGTYPQDALNITK